VLDPRKIFTTSKTNSMCTTDPSKIHQLLLLTIGRLIPLFFFFQVIVISFQKVLGGY
jgi:hypothetical protein